MKYDGVDVNVRYKTPVFDKYDCSEGETVSIDKLITGSRDKELIEIKKDIKALEASIPIEIKMFVLESLTDTAVPILVSANNFKFKLNTKYYFIGFKVFNKDNNYCYYRIRNYLFDLKVNGVSLGDQDQLYRFDKESLFNKFDNINRDELKNSQPNDDIFYSYWDFSRVKNEPLTFSVKIYDDKAKQICIYEKDYTYLIDHNPPVTMKLMPLDCESFRIGENLNGLKIMFLDKNNQEIILQHEIYKKVKFNISSNNFEFDDIVFDIDEETSLFDLKDVRLIPKYQNIECQSSCNYLQKEDFSISATLLGEKKKGFSIFRPVEFSMDLQPCKPKALHIINGKDISVKVGDDLPDI